MGKDWLYWGGGSSGGSGGGGKCRSTKRGSLGGVDHRETQTPSGCMSAVFQLFDFHHSQFANLHRQVVVPSFKSGSFLPEEQTTPLKGVEAPRNSLEIEAAASYPSPIKEEALNIPMGIQIKTRSSGINGDRSKLIGALNKVRSTDDLSSEGSSSSPGSKTPSLVARLMGLDLLPNPQLENLKQELRHRHLTQSQSSSGRSLFDTDIIGTRSLPETPRISSARRSDVDHHHHHRLSLQINKENVGEIEESQLKTGRRRREVTRQQDESRSPGNYARQIVKQVRESVVGRRVGVDITNTIRNRDQRRDDDHVVLLQSKKPSKGILARVGDDEYSSPKKQSTPSSSSPRLRLLEIKNKNQVVSTLSPKLSPSPLSSSVSAQPQPGKVSPKQKPQLSEQQHQNQKCSKIASELHGQKLKRNSTNSCVFRNKQEEPFVRSSAMINRAKQSEKKCKKTPLSSELLSINVPTLFPVKKHAPSPATKLLQKKQSQEASDALLSWKRRPQLSSCSSQTYKQEATHMPTTVQHQDSIYRCSSHGTEYQYITQMLKRIGIDKNTPVSFAKWHSPSHPLDPSIFHHLELSFPIPTAATTKESQLSHRCNRKLIFQLVDELLVEVLKPYINSKPWECPLRSNHPIHGSELVDKICTEIRKFPTADCRVLEDIDALIEEDLSRGQFRPSAAALEEEGEAIVAELERDLVESVVHEMAVVFVMGNNRV